MTDEGKIIKDRYLGDGVYASYDGWHIWLDLRGQDSTTRIAMEPAVINRFLVFLENLTEIREKKAKG